ncbi:MAG TPA: WYL domain-containing protein [Thermoanaerobaculia bacterium]|nr:WYL domain-containing protein [Thermoanaerobaculia bacterium]
MRADRLLSTLLLLQANGKMTVRQLAKRLEVSYRTAYRDLEALGAAGVPVLALRGSRGGWQLDEEWRTRVPGLDEAELRAFLMAQPRVIGDAPLAAAAERALDKLMAAMPVSLRARAAFIRQRLYVDTSGWRGVAENLAFLPIVQDAVSRDRKLAIEYRKRDRQLATRTIDPLGVVAKGMTWYLVANTTEGFRTFRVSRIEKATMLDIPAQRPPHFDLAVYWKSSTEKFRESRRQFSVTVRLEPRAAEEFMRWRTAKPVPSDAPDPEGWVTLRVEFDDEEHACFMVQGLGARAEIVEPATLRERVLASAAAVIARGRAQSVAGIE